MATSPGEIMTIEELAEYLKVSKSTLYKLVQNGGLPAQKIGKQWRFSKSAVEDWFRQHPQRSNIKRI
jgi:excisionase family DNA binding protein